jgi:uncharacterized protein
MNEAKKIIKNLGLKPLLEGGYFKVTYRSSHNMLFNNKTHSINSAIYYLLESHDFSCWHRMSLDELWHYYGGANLTLYQIDPLGVLTVSTLGNISQNPDAQPQLTVPAGNWFAARVSVPDSFTLVGCTVAPGFDWADFEIGERNNLLAKYPQHEKLILQLSRESIPEVP